VNLHRPAPERFLERPGGDQIVDVCAPARPALQLRAVKLDFSHVRHLVLMPALQSQRCSAEILVEDAERGAWSKWDRVINRSLPIVRMGGGSLRTFCRM
jgi:hypothetical protein